MHSSERGARLPDPALLFRRRLTCMTQRSGCASSCGSSRYSTTSMRTCLPCSILFARGDASPASPTMGSAWVSGPDGNTHRHDSGVSTASASSEPAGEYHRTVSSDSSTVISMQFVYLLASGAWHEHMFASVHFLRGDRNGMHLDHHLEGVDLVGVEAAVSSERIVGNPEVAASETGLNARGRG